LVSISVTDTGIGIPEERIPEIFEPFHQLDGSATRRFGGTGLGLTMVRRIIEAHSSQVRVASVVGEGSYFEFTLPSFDQSKHKIAGRESSLTQ
jgi:two-component system cell cycle sensor histidine kinase PleC